MKTIAVAYYPEHISEAQWPRDLERMRLVGINVVRVFEFAWSRLEPQAGEFNFGWVHRFMALTREMGIQVILCTPTASQPPWLMLEYPESVYQDEHGHQARPGFRRQYCFSSPSFLALGVRITRKMIDECKSYANIMAWQIDNELGFNFCKCPQCRRRYQQWLQASFSSVEVLNAAWGLVFWSAEFNDWGQIDFGMTSPESKLAERNFFSDLVIDFLREFVELIHANHPGIPVTSNFMGNFDQIDYFKAAETLDVIGWDFYYELYTLESASMAHDLMRCLKRQLHWTLENGTGCLNNWRHMDSAQMLLLGVKAWAHGEVLHTKFPWRAFAFGFEQYVLALVDQADRPTRAYQATKQLHDVYQRLPDLTIDDFVSEVAFVLNYHDSWAYQSLSGSPNYVFVAERYYTSLHRLGLCLDVIAETADFSRYRVLVFPPSLFCDETLADKVRAFIAEGGVVILSSQSFSRNRNFQWHAEPAPFHLQDVFGVSVREGCYAANYLGNATSCLGFDFASLDAEPSGFDEYRLSSDIFSLAGLPAMTYFEALEENGAEVWARYQEGLFSGQAAITSHVYGKGHAILVGCGLSEEGLRAVYRHVLARAGVTMTPAVNREVEIVPLRRHTVYLNHTQIACREPLGTGTALLGQVEDDMLVLPPYGFAVVAHTLSAATIEENILIAVDK